MQAERWKEVEQLLHGALAQPPENRLAFLDRACKGDQLLRREVQSLLEVAPAAGSFLEGSPVSSMVEPPPTLIRGQKLGNFEILEIIGQGGMGEVYRARDSKLGRDVALKVLPEVFARDDDRIARLNREAHVLASLNHPNIASIYGLEEAGDIRALVMELVAGPTLSDRIAARSVVPAEALLIARQIAEALECAHEKGIVHRDLKPANVKVTPEGQVKVLDFGLAKLTERGMAADSKDGTETGVILGTASYMSPEQARGEPADKRADIWAFGAILFEMLTSKRTFIGQTNGDILAAVLTQDPRWEELPAAIPQSIRKLLARCLERDRKRRLTDIGEARIAIEDHLANPAPGVPPPGSQILPWLVSAVLAVTAASVTLTHFREATSAGPLLTYRIAPPEQAKFIHVAPSPDGRILAFTGFEAGALFRLWMRRLDSLNAQVLAGTEGALLPFWSPDSRFIGFWSAHKLKKVDVGASAGAGPPQIITDAPRSGGATWNRDGVILFSGGHGAALYRVPASGGDAKPVTRLDLSRREETHLWPSFLPDGHHFLYTVVSSQPGNAGVYVGSLDSADRKHLLDDVSNATYVTNRGEADLVLFVRRTLKGSGTLMAQRFDTAKLQLKGAPWVVAERVSYDSFWAEGSYAVSENGLLAFLGGTQTQLTWFDRNGRRLGMLGEPGNNDGWVVQLSPDEKHVAVDRRDPNTGTSDVWLIELARGISSRFTFDPKDDVEPIWSPDGKWIVFSSDRKGAFDLYKKATDGGSPEKILIQSKVDKQVNDWSRDGRFLLYTVRSSHDYSSPLPVSGDQTWVLPLSGDAKAAPFHRTEYTKGFGAFSPDGKWIAYMADQSGRFEVYVCAFQAARAAATGDYAGSGEWQISEGGGFFPHWRGDGRELFYATGDGRIMAAPVTTGATFQAGVARVLFTNSFGENMMAGNFAVTGDGQRFLMPIPLQTDSSGATIVFNWTKGIDH